MRNEKIFFQAALHTAPFSRNVRHQVLDDPGIEKHIIPSPVPFSHHQLEKRFYFAGIPPVRLGTFGSLMSCVEVVAPLAWPRVAPFVRLTSFSSR